MEEENLKEELKKEKNITRKLKSGVTILAIVNAIWIIFNLYTLVIIPLINKGIL